MSQVLEGKEELNYDSATSCIVGIDIVLSGTRTGCTHPLSMCSVVAPVLTESKGKKGLVEALEMKPCTTFI